MRKYMQGLTLTELMVVVVIVGILAAIAYPNYREFVARSKRNEARAALLQIATLQERFYLQNNTYTVDMTNLGFAAAGVNTSDTGSYDIWVEFANPNNFQAIADYTKADNEDGRCAWFRIDARGQKTSFPQVDCWTRTR